MTKLFAIFACLVFTLGIIVASVGTVNYAIMKENGLRNKAIQNIDQAIPANPTN
ncbi:hypothetical protein [Brevibacillus dissolubilis]|uniref:hypothetical protein n=1 Tax=Brevibacillus dissolubilis TaxID=1844116 RepID=UPI00159B85FD|nr:hypothetical protein [Brevibacillus dissolubilis]